MHRIRLFIKNVNPGRRGATGVSLSGISWLFKDKDFDQPIDPMILAEKYRNRDEMSPTERLGLMFRKDEFGEYSPELKEIGNFTIGAGLLGYVMGGIAGGNQSYEDFMSANKHTMFYNPRHAQRVARRQLMFDYVRSGTSLGLKCGFYTGCYFLIAHSMTHAFNRVSPFDHALAGFLCGSVWRTVSGPRTMLATGIIGGMLGFFNGTLFWISHQISGESIGQRWARELEEIQARQKKEQDEMAEKRSQLDSPLYRMKPLQISEGDLVKDDSVEAKRQFAAEMFRKAAAEEREELENTPILDRIITVIRGYLKVDSPPGNPDYLPDNQPFAKPVERFTIHTWTVKKKVEADDNSPKS